MQGADSQVTIRFQFILYSPISMGKVLFLITCDVGELILKWNWQVPWVYLKTYAYIDYIYTAYCYCKYSQLFVFGYPTHKQVNNQRNRSNKRCEY